MNARLATDNKARQFLLLAGALLLLVWFAQSKSPINHFDVSNVSAGQAKALIDEGALVVDVRGPESYAGRHIPGALSVPLATLEQAIPASLSQAISKPVVVYCGDGVSIGPEGTALLNKAGFSKAVNLEQGIQGWADAGLPVVTQSGSGA